MIINNSILEISKSIILRIQSSKKNLIIKDIKIAYLIEATNFEPWFIGTEYCEILKLKKIQRS